MKNKIDNLGLYKDEFGSYTSTEEGMKNARKRIFEGVIDNNKVDNCVKEFLVKIKSLFRK